MYNLWNGPNGYVCVVVGISCSVLASVAFFGRRRDFFHASLLFASVQLTTGIAAWAVGQSALVFVPPLALGMLFAAGWVGCTNVGQRVWRRGVQVALSRRFGCALLVAFSPAAALWWAVQVEDPSRGNAHVAESQSDDDYAAAAAAAAHAKMDDDRSVYLFSGIAALLTNEQQKALEVDFLRRHSLGAHVLRLGAATPGCNCHGWVFTGGRYFVGAGDVERILTTNGYTLAAIPRPGDLVVYRDGAGVLMHSGVVHSASEKLVLIESLWMNLGRYLHPVEAYGFYGAKASFYRSQRKGHLLQGMESSASLTGL